MYFSTDDKAYSNTETIFDGTGAIAVAGTVTGLTVIGNETGCDVFIFYG
jgi:hypothetical protein